MDGKGERLQNNQYIVSSWDVKVGLTYQLTAWTASNPFLLLFTFQCGQNGQTSYYVRLFWTLKFWWRLVQYFLTSQC